MKTYRTLRASTDDRRKVIIKELNLRKIDKETRAKIHEDITLDYYKIITILSHLSMKTTKMVVHNNVEYIKQLDTPLKDGSKSNARFLTQKEIQKLNRDLKICVIVPPTKIYELKKVG
ncbi:MAG: hypothetical protein KAQ94_05970 [Arcobacteraceae bacterium]|nr:hypothetical protein [Arcobacteraceae bacterium]